MLGGTAWIALWSPGNLLVKLLKPPGLLPGNITTHSPGNRDHSRRSVAPMVRGGTRGRKSSRRVRGNGILGSGGVSGYGTGGYSLDAGRLRRVPGGGATIRREGYSYRVHHEVPDKRGTVCSARGLRVRYRRSRSVVAAAGNCGIDIAGSWRINRGSLAGAGSLGLEEDHSPDSRWSSGPRCWSHHRSLFSPDNLRRELLVGQLGGNDHLICFHGCHRRRFVGSGPRIP